MCLLGTCVIGFSQQNRPGEPIGGIIVKGGRNPGGSMLVNVSGGVSTPATATKENSFLGSGKNVNLGIYAPFFTFGLKDNFTLGANINGSYAKIDGDVNATPKYNIVGETAAPTGAKSGNGNATAYTAEAGLQANFSFGKITLSPIVNAGYFSFKQDGFKLTQSNQANGQTYDFKLYNQADIKGNGFAFIPKFRIGYFPGKLGLHLESSYVLGPEITSSKTTLQPLGAANAEGNYQLDQLMAGKQIATVSTTAFKSVGFNFGITYALGNTKRAARKKARAAKAKSHSQNQSIVNTNKSNTKDRVANENQVMMQDELITKNPMYQNKGNSGENPLSNPSNAAKPGEPIGGIIVKGGKNPGGQMNIITNSQGEFTFTTAEAADFKFTIETPETMNENGNMARPGNPIGGIIVKGGKNPGGQMFTTSTNGNGDIEFKNLPAGNYKFTLTAPTAPKEYENFRKGWDGTVKGGSKAASKTINPLYEGNGNSGTNPLSNPSNAAKPGEPIGGIIVKGGRNPGGQMKIISDNNGEFTFTNAEAADFKFTIEIPETTNENGNTARPGGPIGGIIVKGGKNPGGQMFTTTTNGNGDIEFKNLPAGNYKFTLTAPTAPREYESFRKGWDGTVKGGSK